MSLLKQIEDKGAVVSWCPLDHSRGMVALGTKDSSGVGFDDLGGELEIHSLDFSTPGDLKTNILGTARSSSRFSSIAWSQMASYSSMFPMGLLAGGMSDGTINIWNPDKVFSNAEDALVVSLEQHTGAIPGLHFNPHPDSSHLLASGGADAEVFVTSLENPEAPTVFVPAPPPTNAKHTADITKVAWNSQVVHILASAAQNGSCYVWDLRHKRSWCELREPSGGAISDIAWNPDQGLHIVTASGDDRNPVIKLWDLRSSTALPLATLQGHTEGILSVSWCPSDTSLLLSCGKDNRTIMWDLFNLQPVYELPVKEAQQSQYSSDQHMFGSLASSASHRRYHVAWSPCLPAVVSAASFDRKVQFFSLTGARSKIGKAPKWLRRPVGATFGFGGKLVKIQNNGSVTAAANTNKKASNGGKLQIFQVEENPDLVASSDFFHDHISHGRYKEFCEYRSKESTDSDIRKVWSLMNVICFGNNAREELLTYLGFDSATISEVAKKYLNSHESESTANIPHSASAEDIFGGETSSVTPKPKAPISPAQQVKVEEMIDLVAGWEIAEPTIRRAVVVGNFELAVDCCLAAGLLAEALLLAQCGDHELRARTQAAFFERQRNKHPFLNILHAVIKNQLMSYVESSDLNNWRETLALLSTYGKSEEFSVLCEALANRLENEMGDKHSAALCFMCAANVHRTIKYWTEELNTANAKLGQLDTRALQDYVEKIIVFTHANPADNLGAECGTYFARYGELLVNQGRLVVASSYLKGSSTAESVLMDRIYHAGNKPAGSRPPPFPFTKVAVESSKPAGSSSGSSTQAAAAMSSSTALPAQTKKVEPVAQYNNAANAVQNPPVQTNAAPAQPVLPAGWIQLFDPNTNRAYYVNQSTGQSQWDPPVSMVPAAAPANFASVTHSMETVTIDTHPKAVDPSPVKPAYVEPAVATTAAAAVAASSSAVNAAAPVAAAAAAAAAAAIPVVSVEAGPLPDCAIALGQMIEAIAATTLTAVEKKQLGVIRLAYNALCEKFQQRQVNDSVLQRLSSFMDQMAAQNFVGATAIQTDLVSTSWNEHKEWLKGLKQLIELAKRK